MWQSLRKVIMRLVKLNFILVPFIGVMISACGKNSTETSNSPVVGRYEQKLDDGSTDILIVKQDGSMSLELTRQVGGPGGISNKGVVPYETNCRVKQSGVVINEREGYMQYEVKFVELGDLTGLRNTEHCAEYVSAFNAIIQTQGVRFSIKRSEYALVK
jgi:hypothetical protein